jgi:hypothetical protein
VSDLDEQVADGRRGVAKHGAHRRPARGRNRFLIAATVLVVGAGVALALNLRWPDPAKSDEPPLEPLPPSLMMPTGTPPPAAPLLPPAAPVPPPPAQTPTATETPQPTPEAVPPVQEAPAQPPPPQRPTTQSGEPELPVMRSPTTRAPISVEPEPRAPFPNQNPPLGGEPEQGGLLGGGGLL